MADHWTPLASGNAKYIRCSNWIDCSQAAPSTVQPLNPNSLALYSNLDDSYTSTTNGKKAVFKFASTETLSNFGTSLRPVIVFGGNMSGYGLYVVTALHALTAIAGSLVRATPIIADFDITTLNYNGLSSLTYGSVFAEQVTSSAEAAVTSTLKAAVGYTRSFPLGTSAVATYGLLLECKPQSGNAPSFSSCEASITLSTSGLGPVIVMPVA